MFKSLTLNQIVTRIKEIGNSHAQIKEVGFGDFVDLNAEDINYPCFLFDVDSPTISPLSKRTTYSFQFLFMDLANVAENSKENELEVWSDLTSIAEDVFALMRNPEYQTESWTFEDDVSGEYLREAQKDIIMGVRFTVKIGTFMNNNRCQVPTNG